MADDFRGLEPPAGMGVKWGNAPRRMDRPRDPHNCCFACRRALCRTPRGRPARHVFERRRAGAAEALPDMPSPRRSGAFFAAHLPAGAPWAKAMKEAVLLKKMPPWYADPSATESFRTTDRSRRRTWTPWWPGRMAARPKAIRGICRRSRPMLRDGPSRKPDVVYEFPRAFQIPAIGNHRISESDRAVRIHGRQMGAVRRSAAGRSRARAPHDFVRARARLALAARMSRPACFSWRRK